MWVDGEYLTNLTFADIIIPPSDSEGIINITLTESDSRYAVHGKITKVRLHGQLVG